MGRKEAIGLPEMPAVGAPSRECFAWVTALADRARAGDAAAVDALRSSARKRPDIWDRITVNVLEDGREWRELLIPDDPGNVAESIALERHADRMRSELLNGSDDPIERLLVGRIVSARLAVAHAEAKLTDELNRGGILALLDCRQRQLEAANRQLIRAIESLERVRQLRGPRLAITVGNVNVAANVTAPVAPASADMAPEPDVPMLPDGKYWDADWRIDGGRGEARDEAAAVGVAHQGRPSRA